MCKVNTWHDVIFAEKKLPKAQEQCTSKKTEKFIIFVLQNVKRILLFLDESPETLSGLHIMMKRSIND